MISHPGVLTCSVCEDGWGRERQQDVTFPYAKKRITGDFSLSKNRIVANGDCLKKRPESIIEAFSVLAKTGKRFSPLLREEIGKNLRRIGKATRSSQKAVESFMNIIRGDRAYETLREMHNSRVLGRLIPEFGALSFLVVYEPYHRYTVDEHALYAVKKLVELRDTKYKNLEHLSAVFREVRHKEALIFSLLLHDIGKKGIVKSYRYGSGGGHHEEAGYLEVKNVIERFNLTVGLRTTIEFLVKNHTLMSSVAFKGDTEDIEVIAQFADEVETEKILMPSTSLPMQTSPRWVLISGLNGRPISSRSSMRSPHSISANLSVFYPVARALVVCGKVIHLQE